MDDSSNLAHDLAKTDDGVEALVTQNRVYDPLLFSDGIIKFTAKQYIFLRTYRMGVPLEEAASKAGLSEDQALRFLNKPDTRAWLKDRALKDHIKNEWAEPGKWWKEGNDALGTQKWNRVDLEIWKEFGERVAPTSRKDSGAQPKIEINIDPTAVQEAFRRHQALEAEIVKETT